MTSRDRKKGRRGPPEADPLGRPPLPQARPRTVPAASSAAWQTPPLFERVPRTRTPVSSDHGGTAPDTSETWDAPAEANLTVPEPESTPEVNPLIGGLVHLGLTVHEALIFQSLIEHGPSTARAAIQRSGLDRATGYRVLWRLRARGLVRSSGSRPQRFVGLDATKLLDRVTSFWQDQIELHQLLRGLYEGLNQDALHWDPSPKAPIGRVLTQGPTSPLANPRIVRGHDRVGQKMAELVDAAKEEVALLLRPALIPEPHRSELRSALAGALRRRIRIRLVVDCQPLECDFLSGLLSEYPDADRGLEMRSFAPQLSQLLLVDGRTSLRCLHSALPTASVSNVGLASEDAHFVRTQSIRFHATWREGVPLGEALRSADGVIIAPSNPSSELLRWIERVGTPGMARPETGVSNLTVPAGWTQS
jgi:sugar-specific transcriptional regulator TrmB